MHKNIYISFIHIVKKQKEPRYLSTGEWINKVQYIWKMKYYPVNKETSYQIGKKKMIET